ncbi:MAG TPA: hypothetical protein VK858_12240 [Longimicrobiales bacterium]|nr:hypothetical protein [Longimicrobiales bacterium]
MSAFPDPERGVRPLRHMRWPLAVAVATGVAMAACGPGPGPEFRPIQHIEFPEPDAVDAVILLIGDAGEAEAGTSPILARLGSDVEFWSERLASDSAVTVLFLGDNVYPVGIRARDHPAFETDSMRLWSQIDVVAGPVATARGTRGLFMAGNHDWGNMSGDRGAERLRNEQRQIDAAREQGLAVWLMPAAGEPGPTVLDLEDRVRLLLMDTHWFLQERDGRARAEFFADLQEGLRGAGDRHVILAAHHPYQSAGPHGSLAPGAQAFGLLWLMKKSGTLVQDLNSPIYGDLLSQMLSSFRLVERRPLIFAGGHDHSLQVLDPVTEFGPETVLVSGAGSKLTDLAVSDQLRYAAARPGYMTLVFRQNEAVDLFVTAADSTEVTCPREPEEERATCVQDRAAAMKLVYSERLVPEGGAPTGTPEDTLARW